MTSPTVEGSKEIDADVLRIAERRSVVQPDPLVLAGPTEAGAGFFLWPVAGYADGIPPWGTSLTLRDASLRAFSTSESFTASALAAVCARNAAMGYLIEAEDETVADAASYILNTANQGKGWEDFITKLSMDLYTQDKGAFIELVRLVDNPAAPVVQINTLDAGSCFHTGNWEYPVVYRDRWGKFHKLRWYQVITVAEMPVNIERLPGYQISALTRLLQAAQIFRNIQKYYGEKTGGRNPNAIHVISNVGGDKIKQALSSAQLLADQKLMDKYLEPVLMETIDPTSKPEHVLIEMAMLPDGFDREKEMKLFITILAMAFLTDYGEFAPLPGNNLGTAAESKTMDDKSQRKGQGLFRKIIAQALNFGGIMPEGATFKWDENDVQEAAIRSEIEKRDAEAAAVRIQAGITDELVERQFLVESGRMTEEQMGELESRDAERKAEEERIRQEDAQQQIALRMAAPAPPPGAGGGFGGAKAFTEDRDEFDEEVTGDVLDALAVVRANVQRHIAERWTAA